MMHSLLIIFLVIISASFAMERTSDDTAANPATMDEIWDQTQSNPTTRPPRKITIVGPGGFERRFPLSVLGKCSSIQEAASRQATHNVIDYSQQWTDNPAIFALFFETLVCEDCVIPKISDVNTVSVSDLDILYAIMNYYGCSTTIYDILMTAFVVRHQNDIITCGVSTIASNVCTIVGVFLDFMKPNTINVPSTFELIVSLPTEQRAQLLSGMPIVTSTSMFKRICASLSLGFNDKYKNSRLLLDFYKRTRPVSYDEWQTADGVYLKSLESTIVKLENERPMTVDHSTNAYLSLRYSVHLSKVSDIRLRKQFDDEEILASHLEKTEEAYFGKFLNFVRNGYWILSRVSLTARDLNAQTDPDAPLLRTEEAILKVWFKRSPFSDDIQGNLIVQSHEYWVESISFMAALVNKCTLNSIFVLNRPTMLHFRGDGANISFKAKQEDLQCSKGYEFLFLHHGQ